MVENENVNFVLQDIAVTSVQRGVQKQESKIDASSIVGYALKSASVCLTGIMTTSMNAFATRTRRASTRALELNNYFALQF